jgi:hypothetical protein|tara:strand:+ start:323 stop:781 length:459 start_codon:yes stop_codon:yes gene_type:complete
MTSKGKTGHGGARAGAGRPAKAQQQLQKATNLLRDMAKRVETGLGTLAEDFPSLVKAELELALEPDQYDEKGHYLGIDPKVKQKARQFLISKALDVISVDTRDPMESPLGQFLQDIQVEEQKVTLERKSTYLARPDEDVVLEVGHNNVGGAE